MEVGGPICTPKSVKVEPSQGKIPSVIFFITLIHEFSLRANALISRLYEKQIIHEK